MNDKVAVYAGTKNLYPQMYTALKSLLTNTQMDRVYLFIEDDEFPFPLPENVIAVNVSEQDYFLPLSPNFNSPWSYMTMLRCALATMLPDEKRILWLDCDTIVDEDISDLFEMDLNGYCYAGVLEPQKSKDVFRYINAGVLLCNLELLRGMCKEQEMIAFLNVCKLNWIDQDIINILCQGRIRVIESIYNSNAFTTPCIRPKIIHYAAVKEYTNEWAYRKYAELDMPGVKAEDGGEEDA
jgi:lipopolysaccharide biosynthesis glycosyltransferase